MSDLPHRTDLHVGARVRLRRKAINMSQQDLAAKLGLTFQQIQKYERGSNRISASKLLDTAQALGVGISYFFEGIADDMAEIDTSAEAEAQAFLLTTEGYRIANAFPRISDQSVRRRLIDMIETLAEAH